VPLVRGLKLFASERSIALLSELVFLSPIGARLAFLKSGVGK